MRLSITSTAVDLLTARMGADIKAYQREIRPQLRKAAFVLRREARARLRSHPDIRLSGGGEQRPHQIRRGGSGSQLLRGTVARIRASKETGELQAFIGPPPSGKAFYGKFLELGTGPRSRRGGASTGSLRARPFLRPALEAKLAEVEEILGASFRVIQG